MRMKGDKTMKLSYDFNVMVGRPKPRECFLRATGGVSGTKGYQWFLTPFWSEIG